MRFMTSWLTAVSAGMLLLNLTNDDGESSIQVVEILRQTVIMILPTISIISTMSTNFHTSRIHILSSLKPFVQLKAKLHRYKRENMRYHTPKRPTSSIWAKTLFVMIWWRHTWNGRKLTRLERLILEEHDKLVGFSYTSFCRLLRRCQWILLTCVTRTK